MGANSIPDRAAKQEPTSQEKRRTATGLVPARPSRAGSSTTACTARPSLARVKNRYSAATETKITATSISCSTRTLVPPRSNTFCDRNGRTGIEAAPKMAISTPWMNTSSPTVAVTRAASEHDARA